MSGRDHNNVRLRSRAQRALRVGICTFLASVGLSALVVGTSAITAGASPTTVSETTTLSGSQTLFAATVTVSGSTVFAKFKFHETIAWTQPAQLNTTFDPNTVRQGQSPSPTVSYSTTAPGKMKVTWSITTFVVGWTGVATINLGSMSVSATGPCTLKASGATYRCSLRSGTVTVLTTYPVPGPYVKLAMGATVTITPNALSTLRKATFNGMTSGTKSLQLTETPTTDTLSIPCTVPAGDSLTYALTTLSADDAIEVANSLIVTVGAQVSVPPVPKIDVSFASPTIPLGTLQGSLDMSGPGATFAFGSVLANNVPPVASPGGPYTGTEGSAVHFTGSGSSSVCGFPTLRWDFSDGGVAYGPTPQHTFEGPGTYSGLLTATDVTGLTSTATFTVTVFDLPPVVHAGPPITTQWGLPVALDGSAVDPGTAQQPLLTYSWTFGDGTGGAGGKTVAHDYASPGTYLATFTACDPELFCGASTTAVTVTARATTLSYTGAAAGTVTDASTFKVSLVDDAGHAVVGGTVQFFADGSAVPFASASTNALGTASASYAFGSGSVGPHTVVAAFAGTSLYTPSQTSTGFTVSKDGTALAYSGVASVKVAHTAWFSATLTDDAGRPIAGKTVQFTLGAQSCAGTTNTSGVASCSIAKVTEKSGKYVLSVAFSGTGDYTASSEGIGFQVG